MLTPVMALWLATSAVAQEGPPLVVDPVLEVRPRVQNGYTEGLSRGLLQGTVAFTRSRVGLEVSRGTVRGRVVLSHLIDWEHTDDPIFGEGGGYVRSPPRLDLVEGWGRLEGRLPAGISLDVTFGRQLFTLHRGRLISENDWTVSGRPIDSLEVLLRLGNFKLRLLNFRDFSDVGALVDPGSTLVTLGTERTDPVRSHLFDWVFLFETVETDLRLTTGPFWEIRRGRFLMVLESYVQVDDLDENADPRVDPADDISVAGLASLQIGWTLGPERLLRVSGRYDVASARLDASGQVGGWVAPLGDIYRFYGHMNLFQRPDDTALLGLQDLAAIAVFRPVPRLDLELDAHYFWTAAQVLALGFEADATVRYAFTPFASAEVGYSVFAGGPGLSEVTPIRSPYGTAYADLRVEF